MAVVVMLAPSNDINNPLPLLPGILSALASVCPGEVIEVGTGGL